MCKYNSDCVGGEYCVNNKCSTIVIKNVPAGRFKFASHKGKNHKLFDLKDTSYEKNNPKYKIIEEELIPTNVWEK